MAIGSIPTKSKKQQASQRQYESIWNAIKSADPTKPIQIRCHPNAVKTIIQAVKKEKTRECGVRGKLGMLRQGKLEIVHNPEVVDGKLTGKAMITFKLQWDGTKL